MTALPTRRARNRKLSGLAGDDSDSDSGNISDSSTGRWSQRYGRVSKSKRSKSGKVSVSIDFNSVVGNSGGTHSSGSNQAVAGNSASAASVKLSSLKQSGNELEGALPTRRSESKKLRVLIVDDERSLRRMASKMLDRLGFDSDQLSDGNLVLQFLADRS